VYFHLHIPQSRLRNIVIRLSPNYYRQGEGSMSQMGRGTYSFHAYILIVTRFVSWRIIQTARRMTNNRTNKVILDGSRGNAANRTNRGRPSVILIRVSPNIKRMIEPIMETIPMIK